LPAFIRVPRLNANDDHLIVADIQVKTGDSVSPGQTVAIVESSKATSPIEAKNHGVIIAVLANVGDRLNVGEPLIQFESRKPLDEAKKSSLRVPDEAAPSWVDDLRNKAQPLAGGHAEGDSGWRIEANFLFLGEGVRLASGVHLKANTIVLADGACIGEDVRLHSGEILVGEGARIAARCRADLSGGQTEASRLALGPASLIAEEARLNTCRSIIIGEQSAISPRAMLFTHSYWQSVLDGYPALFGDVIVGDHAWVGAGCQILPGVNIGDGSVVMSNSTVVDHVASGTMVAGVPAQTIRHNLGQKLDDKEKVTVLSQILAEFSDQLIAKGCTVTESGAGAQYRIERSDLGMRQIVLLTHENGVSADQTEITDEMIVISLLPFRPHNPEQPHFSLHDHQFHGKEDALVFELRNTLRRHGIRFRPYAWDSNHKRGLR